MRYILRRILSLILTPNQAWDEIAREPASVDLLIRRYIVPLALLAPVATVIGMETFDGRWSPAHGYLVPQEAIWSAGATTLFASIISIFVLAGIFVLIAPMYGSSRHYPSALKVATYGAVPVLVAGALLILPVMVMISAWCRKRSRIAVAEGTSPRSLPQSSSGRLLVMIVERFS